MSKLVFSEGMMKQAAIRWLVYAAAILLPASCTTPRPDPAAAAGLETRLQALSGFEYGGDRAPAEALTAYVSGLESDRERGMLEPRLAAFAEDETATRAARRHVIETLGRVGTAQSAPVLIRLLGDPDLGDDASMALQRMADPRAAARVRAALPSTVGMARERAIHILGVYGDRKAVAALARDARSDDARLAAAAVTALGRIAGPEAAAALIDLLPDAEGEVRLAIWPALLACRHAAVREGADDTALAVAAALESASAPAHVLAASRAMTLESAPPSAAADGAAKLLASDDPNDRAAGAEVARRRLDDARLLSVCSSLPDLPVPSQVALLGILEDRGLRDAAPIIAERISSADETVRHAAIRALARAGSEASVIPLARAAAAESGDLQRAARQSLRRISGPGVDEALLELARQGEPALRLECLSAIGDRGQSDAVPIVIAAAGDPDSTVRRAAIRQLGSLAGQADWPRMLKLVQTPPYAEDRSAWIAAAGEAGMRIPGSGASAAAALAGADDDLEGRVSLLALAGRLGDDNLIPELSRAAADAQNEDVRNAALRALGNWSSEAALPALLEAASQTDESSRRLAARGAIQLVRRADPMGDDQRIEYYRGIASHLEHPDDRRLLLAAVADVNHPEAFALAAEFLDDGEVRAEAEVALQRIAAGIQSPDESMRAVLQRIAAESGTSPDPATDTPPAP